MRGRFAVMQRRFFGLFGVTCDLCSNGFGDLGSSFRRGHPRGWSVVAESNLTVFKKANVSREATLGVIGGKPPSSSDAVVKICQDHVMDPIGTYTFPVGPSRVRFIT